METQSTPQHQWLLKLVGQWSIESEMICEPGQPPTKSRGTETVRALGNLWIICEGRGEMPASPSADSADSASAGAGPAIMQTIMTLGYDSARGTFVGTFIASVMTHLWIYESGQLDATGRKLTLDAEGPSFSAESKMARYQDAIEFVSDDHRVLTSQVLGDDGKWTQFLTAHYRRVKARA